MDLAELTIKIDSKGAKSATADLNAFQGSAHTAKMAVDDMEAVTHTVFQQLEKDMSLIENKSMVFQGFDQNAEKVYAVETALNRLLNNGVSPNSEGVQRLTAEYRRLQKAAPQANQGLRQSSYLLQNIGYLAQDAPFAIMSGNMAAVANNIPMVATGFQHLTKTAGGTFAGLKMLGSVLMGPTGIILALGTLLPSAIMLGQSGLFDFGEEAEESGEKVQTLQERLDDLEKSFSRFESRKSIAMEIAGDFVDGNDVAAQQRRLGIMRQIQTSLIEELNTAEKEQKVTEETISKYQRLLGIKESLRGYAIDIASQNGEIPGHIEDEIGLRQALIQEQSRLESLQMKINSLKEDEKLSSEDILRLEMEIGERQEFLNSALGKELEARKESTEELERMSTIMRNMQAIPPLRFFNDEMIKGRLDEIAGDRVSNIQPVIHPESIRGIRDQMKLLRSEMELAYDPKVVREYQDEIDRLQEKLRDLTGETENLNNGAKRLGMTFSSAAEDAIVKWQGFGNLVTGILEDITRIMVRMQVTEPLAGAATNFFSGMELFGGGRASDVDLVQGVEPVGDVIVTNTGRVLKPHPKDTLLAMKDLSGFGGQAKSPVNLEVNVINETSSQVDIQHQRKPNGDVELVAFIRDVSKGLFNSGQLDRTMRDNYGVSRKGIQRG